MTHPEHLTAAHCS